MPWRKGKCKGAKTYGLQQHTGRLEEPLEKEKAGSDTTKITHIQVGKPNARGKAQEMGKSKERPDISIHKREGPEGQGEGQSQGEGQHQGERAMNKQGGDPDAAARRSLAQGGLVAADPPAGAAPDAALRRYLAWRVHDGDPEAFKVMDATMSRAYGRTVRFLTRAGVLPS